MGPALASILGLAATPGHGRARAAFLLAVYSVGLAVPFLLTAVAFTRATTAFAFVKRHYAVINGVAGVLLIGIGVLVAERRAVPAQHRGAEGARRLGPELLPGRLGVAGSERLHPLGRLDPEQAEHPGDRALGRQADATAASPPAPGPSAPTTRQSR